MDPNTILDVFSGLDLRVIVSLAFVAGLLRASKLQMAICIAIPMVLGAIFGYLVTPVGAANAELFSAVLLNGTGAVVSGRVAAPIVTKILNLGDGPPPNQTPLA